MKLRIISLLLALVTLLSFAACAKDGGDTSTTTAPTGAPEAPKDTATAINIYTLNGTTGFGMGKLMQDSAANAASKYTFQVKSDVSDVTAAIINGSADIAALPTNAAANLYNVTGGEVEILAVNTLGCLYLLTGPNATVTSFEDLRGKTVYVPAQNPTFIFTYLCQKNGLTVGTDVILDSTTYAAPANLKDAVAGGLVDIAVLPEPMVTIAVNTAKKDGRTVTNAMDLTAEWNKVSTPGSLVQGCIVVRKAFLEQNPGLVAGFLAEYKASIEYTVANPTEAGEMIVASEIFTNAAVAAQAIPKCNLCYLEGASMKRAMETYLNVLYGIKPASIGGKLPAADFYYNAG